MVDRREWVPDEAVEQLTVRRAFQKVEDPLKMAADILKEALPVAALSMVHLAIHSPTEGIRYNASKYVMDRTLGDGKDMRLPDNKPAWDRIFDSAMVEVESALKKHSEE